jgi:hypothetical protein
MAVAAGGRDALRHCPEQQREAGQIIAQGVYGIGRLPTQRARETRNWPQSEASQSLTNCKSSESAVVQGGDGRTHGPHYSAGLAEMLQFHVLPA